AQAAFTRARAGAGPSLIECMTYRHSGHSRADPGAYRPKGELERWKKDKDPINIYRERMKQFGIANDQIAKIEADVNHEVEIATEFPKSRYMSNGQLKCPLVVRTTNGAGSRFGAQHSQSVENWAMMIPGLKVVAPSTPRDVIGLLAAAVRDPDPVIFFEHKSLYPTKGDVPEGEIVDRLGSASVVRAGKDATILALALMVPRALDAAEKLTSEHGIDCEV